MSKEQRKVRVYIGKRVSSERTARKKILKELGISNKKFKRQNRAAKKLDEGYFFQYDSDKKAYIGVENKER